MQQSKLLDYLKTTTLAERKRLWKAVRSPFFTTNPQVAALYDVLAVYAPRFDSPNLSKQSVFAALFPSHTYSDIKLRNLMTELMAVVEQCFVAMEMEGSPTRHRMLAQSLNKRGLVGYFEKTTQAALEELDKSTIADIDVLREKLLLQQAQYYHPSFKKLESPAQLFDIISSLSILHEAEQKRLACDEVIVRKALSKKAANTKETTDIQPFAKQYQLIYDLLESGDADKLELAKDWLKQHFHLLGKDDRQFGLMHLLNFCISQHNKGVAGYNHQILELYKFGLQKDALLENGWLTGTMFLNITATAAALGEFGWAEGFIAEFEPKLAPASRGAAGRLAKAHLFFFQRKFSTALDAMQGFEATNLDQDLIARMLLLRCYFELFLADQSYASLCLTNCTANEKFLKRKRMLNENKAGRFLSLIALLKSVVRLKSQGKWNKEQQLKHKEMAAQTTNMILKSWFTDRIEKI